jgi:GNAT superfamily N-acetyltransferase
MPPLLRFMARGFGIHAWRIFSRVLSARPAAAAPRGIALRFLPQPELEARCPDRRLDLNVHKARAAFARGEVCVGAFDRATLVGYAWFAYQPSPHVDGIWMEFDRRAVYTYRSLVRADYRGRGIAPALYRFADSFFLEHGRTFTVLCVEAHNKLSIAAAERSGARLAGYTAYVSAPGIFFSVRTPGAKRLGYRFYIADPAANGSCMI